MKGYAVVSIKANDEIYLLSDDEGVVNGFPSQAAALRRFEAKYNQAHGRGYVGSMSACIHYMQFEYRCHEVIADVQSLMPSVVEPYSTIRSVYGESGGFKGILCTGPRAAEWHSGGVQPRLVQSA